MRQDVKNVTNGRWSHLEVLFSSDPPFITRTSMGAPICSALTKLAPHQNLSSKGSERENAEKFCVTTLVIFPPMNFPESRAKWNLDVDMMGNSAWIEMCHFVMATTCNITKASSIKRILVVNKSEDIWGGEGRHRYTHIISNLFLFMTVKFLWIFFSTAIFWG